MNIIQHFYVVTFGGFTEIYEAEITTDKTTTIDIVKKHFNKKLIYGRDFNDSIVYPISQWREIVIYIKPNLIRFENRNKGPISIKLLPCKWLHLFKKIVNTLNKYGKLI